MWIEYNYGAISKVSYYVDDTLNGIHFYFLGKDELFLRGHYSKGKMTDTWYIYDNTGSVDFIREYRKDTVVNTYVYVTEADSSIFLVPIEEVIN